MSLSKLSFTTVERPVGRVAVDPTIKRRQKMLDGIDQQIKAYDTVQKGGKPTRTKPNGETASIRTWFYRIGDQEYCDVKYGNQFVAVAGNKHTIEVTKKLGVVGSLKLVRAAVEAGDLDKQIAKVAVRVGRGKKK